MKFFFYGSLRTGYWNQWILSDTARKVGDAQTLRPFKMYIGDYGNVPTVVPVEVGKSLRGELYELDETDSQRVYQLETGYDSGMFDVTTPDGVQHQAMIFHHTTPQACPYLRQDYTEVPSNDYTLAVSKTGKRL